MSDYDLPDLPSDKDLGLTEEEIKELEAEFSDGGPEMTAEEMATLLGEEAPALAPTPSTEGTGTEQPAKKERRDVERARKKAEKEAAKGARAEEGGGRSRKGRARARQTGEEVGEGCAREGETGAERINGGDAGRVRGNNPRAHGRGPAR